MQPKTILCAALLGLSACAPPMTGDAPVETCREGAYDGLVGRPLAAVTLPQSLDTRVIRPNEMVTQDYRPDRLNLELDGEGTIIRAYCG
ncbi:Peptidase inhibitor I78 family protein [Tranquillimonas rosea]|uniref:Peptidase inhibitor I78 family protein n=1 Tax=Tranquillimonas rosea TaxID=641238 RepID=A0A1H9U785_9RHOB|nr:I78 family peptidase inhibitor [Tranquillimonas rosea]SES05004.1 Peptidase inhibitor I78 family protein [Tranquillimonas rosea]